MTSYGSSPSGMVHDCHVELDSAYLTRIAQLPCCRQQCTGCRPGKRVRPSGRRLGTARGCTAGCGSSSQASPGARFVRCRKSGGTQVKVELSLSRSVVEEKILHWLKCVAAVYLWSCGWRATHQSHKVGTPRVPQEMDECDLESFGRWPSVWHDNILKWKGTKTLCWCFSPSFPCFVYLLFMHHASTHQQYVSHDGPVQRNQRFAQSHENLQCAMKKCLWLMDGKHLRFLFWNCVWHPYSPEPQEITGICRLKLITEMSSIA